MFLAEHSSAIFLPTASAAACVRMPAMVQRRLRPAPPIATCCAACSIIMGTCTACCCCCPVPARCPRPAALTQVDEVSLTASRRSLLSVLAAASVLPVVSSMTCVRPSLAGGTLRLGHCAMPPPAQTAPREHAPRSPIARASHLGVDVLVRAEDREARAVGGARELLGAACGGHRSRGTPGQDAERGRAAEPSSTTPNSPCTRAPCTEAARGASASWPCGSPQRPRPAPPRRRAQLHESTQEGHHRRAHSDVSTLAPRWLGALRGPMGRTPPARTWPRHAGGALSAHHHHALHPLNALRTAERRVPERPPHMRSCIFSEGRTPGDAASKRLPLPALTTGPSRVGVHESGDVHHAMAAPESQQAIVGLPHVLDCCLSASACCCCAAASIWLKNSPNRMPTRPVTCMNFSQHLATHCRRWNAVERGGGSSWG